MQRRGRKPAAPSELLRRFTALASRPNALGPREEGVEILRLYHGEKWPIGTIAGPLEHRPEVIEIEAESYRLK